MELYADVIVDISHEKLDKSFQYRVPERLRSKIQVGMTVKIPFGKANREMTGYVVNLTDQTAIYAGRIKEILDIYERAETIESKMMGLAAWIHSQYGSTMNQALKTVLPVKTKVQEKQQKTIRLLLTGEEAQEYLAEAKRKHYVARVRLVEALLASETKMLSYSE
ncbi:MAG: primosomal protein N', partial [Clostridiales bacterium]|nr:primosomal protein N' [Clostridiales bacterium]